ncbi:hypothetical protein HO173_006714 [Letharia columbiana]|uniref:YDG domain-containing protein n=1 Tax=Letharia columbiana TaxID=112416 RepID=A0A8H6L4E4_9LECA|nr:uncharacterized protein HO173_006714 [Letharia columbiana]KAF6235087.1 hypothetical protein HO173_006714 [Letharia columbiana]
MSQTNKPPVATMTVGGTNQAETMGLLPTEAAASESEEIEPTFAPPTLALDTVDGIMTKAESNGLKPATVPSSPNAIVTFPFYPEIGRYEPQAIIGRFIVQLMKPRQLTTNERQVVFNIVKALSQIETFTRAAEERLQIKFMLTGILGVWPKATRPYEFPETFQEAAAAILAKVEGDLDIEEVVDETRPASTSPAPASKGKKRGRKAADPRSPESRELPALNDLPVQSIMHNTVLTDGRRRVYRIDDKSATRPCNSFGHNGIAVGQWWPYRICALRDGAHGAMQSGIAGSEKSGAYSIVVSGDYDELDKDEKDILYYSGSDSNANTDPANPIVTHYTKALQQSRRDDRPIRVLRTSAGRADHCPSKGIRYDGLYRIISDGIAKNMRGGAYVRFKLVREANQPEIDMSRPTQAEKDVYDRLKNSI